MLDRQELKLDYRAVLGVENGSRGQTARHRWNGLIMYFRSSYSIILLLE